MAVSQPTVVERFFKIGEEGPRVASAADRGYLKILAKKIRAVDLGFSSRCKVKKKSVRQGGNLYSGGM